MGQVDLSGSLTAGPSVASDGGFPATSSTTQLALVTRPKSCASSSACQGFTLASPSAYLAIGAISPSLPLTKGDTFYLKSDAAISVRLTLDDGTNTSTSYQVVLPLQGTLLYEPPTAQPLLGVEVKGSATIEWFASGQS